MSTQYCLYSACYFFSISIFGIVIPFLPEHLNGLGFMPEVVGVLVALIPFGRIGIPNILSFLADKTANCKKFLIISALVCVVSAFALSMLHTAMALGIVVVIFAGFWGTQLSLLESMTIRSFDTQSNIIGRIRLWGTIGFMVAVQIYAWVQSQNHQSIFGYMLLGVCSCLFILNLLLPNQLGNCGQCKKEKTESLLFLPKGAFVWGLLLSGFLCQASLGPYYTQFVPYLKQHGFSSGSVSLLFQVTMVLEILAFFWIGSFTKFLGLKNTFLLSVFLTSLRWFLMGVAPDSTLVVFMAQGLHIASFAFFASTGTWLIKEHFPLNQQAQAQTVFAGASYGLGSGLGCIASGYLWSIIGGEKTFYIAAAVSLFGFLIGYLLIKEKRAVDELQHAAVC